MPWQAGAALLWMLGTGAGCRKAPPGVQADDGSAAPLDAATPLPAEGAKLWAVVARLFVSEQPRKDAPHIGSIALGASVGRDPEPVSVEGCEGGWFHVYPRGFVCASQGGTLDAAHPVLRALGRAPDLRKPLPYFYGTIRANTPLYLAIPTVQEQRASEARWPQHMKWWRENRASVEEQERQPPALQMPPGPVPWWLEGGRKVPNVSWFAAPAEAIFANRLRRGSQLGFLGGFANGDPDDRSFLITADLRIVPRSKVRRIVSSSFHGEEPSLATGVLGFVRATCRPRASRCVHSYRWDEAAPVEEAELHPSREPVWLRAESKRLGAQTYVQSTNGSWFREGDVVRARAPQAFPQEAERGERWMDLSTDRQCLTLWEGKRMVYATLVSAPSRLQGSFHIQSKQVTDQVDDRGRPWNAHFSMDGVVEKPVTAIVDGVGGRADPEELEARSQEVEGGGKRKRAPESVLPVPRAPPTPFDIRDIPYVQYLRPEVTLRSAYWHDSFGQKQDSSHIDLAPIDAHKVFFWTSPPLPEGWHGVLPESASAGTLILVHP